MNNKVMKMIRGGFVPLVNGKNSMMDFEGNSIPPEVMKTVKLASKMRKGMDKGTLLNHLKDIVHDEKTIHQVAQGLLDKTSPMYALFKLIPTEGDFEELAKSAVYQEPAKIGSDMGSRFVKYIRITHGVKQDKQMRTASDLYKVQNWPAFNSLSSKYWVANDGTKKAYEALYACAGEMRQGVWYPDIYTPGHGRPVVWWDACNYQFYASRLMTKQMMYREIRHYLMTDADRTWLDQGDSQSADAFYAIPYIKDSVTIANGMEFSPVELKIYICKCKEGTSYSPAADWFAPNTAEKKDGQMRNDYVYDQDAPAYSLLPGSELSTLGSVAHYDEASVHVGATPFYSAIFRKHWEVVDVVKQEIMPTDKFTLEFERHYRHAFSVRELEAGHDEFLTSGIYCEGDYALLITFKGKEAFMRYDGTITEGQQPLRETDVSPSKILVTSHSSFGIASPNLIYSENAPGTSKQTTNYIAGEGRVLDDEIQTFAFHDAQWKPEVITNVSVKEGGER